jgi:MFS transporter, SP family, arabinose:H+ symporter
VLLDIGEQNVDAELEDIRQSIDVEHGHAKEPLFMWKYRVPIFLAITIGLFNQLSGINTILYYLNDIFAKAGFSKSSAGLQSVMIGLTNLIFTLTAMSIIDKAGRKTLLLIGSVGCAASLGAVAALSFIGGHERWLVWLLIGFIGSFAFSQGAVIWVYLGEVFPNRVRAKGQSLGSFTHWITNAAVSQLFPIVYSKSHGAPFAFYSLMMIVQFFVVLFVYPETKGHTLEDMQRRLGIA